MSEDPTKDIGQKYDTRPILETLLTEMREGFKAMNSRLDGVDARLDRLELRLEKVEGQLDRVTSVAHETRADLRELKGRIKEPA